MGITERREREKEEVRRRILDAARELFATEGYDRVTMRRIAEAIEYSPTALYVHFEDKEDLVRALCQEDFSRLLGVFRSQAPPADPLDWIRVLGRAYARFGIEHPNHYRFMFMTPAKHGAQPEVSAGEQSFAILRAAVEKALAAGRLPAGDPVAMAQVLWANIHGAVSLLISLPAECWPEAPARPDLVDQVIEAGIRGLRAAAHEAR